MKSIILFTLTIITVISTLLSYRWHQSLPDVSSLNTGCYFNSMNFSPENLMQKADKVFLGEVISVFHEQDKNHYMKSNYHKFDPSRFPETIAEIYVSDVFKGVLPGNVQLVTKYPSEVNELRKGERYIVFSQDIQSFFSLNRIDVKSLPCGVFEEKNFGKWILPKLNRISGPSSAPEPRDVTFYQKLKIKINPGVKVRRNFVTSQKERQDFLSGFGVTSPISFDSILICVSDGCPLSIDVENMLRVEGFPYTRLDVEFSSTIQRSCDFYLSNNIDLCGGPGTKLRAPIAIVGNDLIVVDSPDTLKEYYVKFKKNNS